MMHVAASLHPMPSARQGHIQRIAIVCHSHPSLSKGGAEIAAFSLFEGLLGLGIDAIFITACAERNRSRLELGSDREYAVYYDPGLYDHLYHLASSQVVAELLTIIRQEKVTLVNFQHFFHFGIDAIRAVSADQNIRTFVTLHEFLSICHHHGQMITRPSHTLCERSSPAACNTCFPENTRQQFVLRRRLFLEAFAAVDGFISPSQFLADRFALWGLASDRIKIIENGLARGSIPSASLPPPDTEGWTFGFFGQINPFKGVNTILQAVRLIEQKADPAGLIHVKLHGNIIGQSETFSSNFASLIEKSDLLSYSGPYENSAVSRLMASCHYVIVPSTWWENSPVVIQEAFAARRPVICAGIGGMAEKVQAGVSGLHFAVGNASSLARAMITAASPSTYEQLSSGIPPVSNQVDMARAYLEVFTKTDEGSGAEAMGNDFYPNGRPLPIRRSRHSALVAE